MNIRTLVDAADAATTAPTATEAQDALDVLKRLAAADPSAAAALDLSELLEHQPRNTDALDRDYPADFEVTESYRDSLPDLQNGPVSLIKGAHAAIQHVGISNFRLPLGWRTRAGVQMLETSVTGSVSLAASKKGINMSRIMRSFYKQAGEVMDFDQLSALLRTYETDLESVDARIMLRARLPLMRSSLRSGLEGYQYYDAALELVRENMVETRILHLDYVYSSTCPCSLELSEHARVTRGQIATPHSQRSVARLSLVLGGSEPVHVEDVIALCNAAIPTETQVMVKREDEQAFAELNGSNPIFVEDAVRLLCEAIEGDARIGDFRVAASHQESLHSHDAVSVLSRGETFAGVSIDPTFFESLIHTR